MASCCVVGVYKHSNMLNLLTDWSRLASGTSCRTLVHIVLGLKTCLCNSQGLVFIAEQQVHQALLEQAHQALPAVPHHFKAGCVQGHLHHNIVQDL